MSQFVERLVAAQRQNQLTDAAFAAHLGVDRVTWVRVRHGRRRPPRSVIEGALRRWPELAPLYAESVSDETATAGRRA